MCRLPGVQTSLLPAAFSLSCSGSQDCVWKAAICSNLPEMSLPPAVDCVAFCVACIVNIISSAALGTDRAQERSLLLAETIILTHLSGFAASCVTAAGHKAVTDPECRGAAWMQGIINSCLVTSATSVPTYFSDTWLKASNHIFLCCPQDRQTLSLALKIPFLLAAPSPLCLPDIIFRRVKLDNTRGAHIPGVYFCLVKGSSSLAWRTAFVGKLYWILLSCSKTDGPYCCRGSSDDHDLSVQ